MNTVNLTSVIKIKITFIRRQPFHVYMMSFRGAENKRDTKISNQVYF